MAISENITPAFCRINALLDLMSREVTEHNNTDFNGVEALLPAIRNEIDSLWNLVEKEVAA